MIKRFLTGSVIVFICFVFLIAFAGAEDDNELWELTQYADNSGT